MGRKGILIVGCDQPRSATQIFEVPRIVFGLSEVWTEIKNKKIRK